MSVIASPAVGDLTSTSTFGAPVAAQLATPATQISFTPTGNLDTPLAGTATWVTLGNVTVPAWAGSAIVVWSVAGVYENGAAPGTVNVTFKIGTAAGAAIRILGPSVSLQRFYIGYNDLITAPPTGSQSCVLSATWVAGTTPYRLDTNDRVGASIIFLP